MLHGILAALGAFCVWAASEFVGEMFGELVAWATGPLRRPLWNLYRTASWAWPLYVTMAIALTTAVVGYWSLDPDVATWKRIAGLVACFGGAIASLLAPFVWRDARRTRDA